MRRAAVKQSRPLSVSSVCFSPLSNTGLLSVLDVFSTALPRDWTVAPRRLNSRSNSIDGDLRQGKTGINFESVTSAICIQPQKTLVRIINVDAAVSPRRFRIQSVVRRDDGKIIGHSNSIPNICRG